MYYIENRPLESVIIIDIPLTPLTYTRVKSCPRDRLQFYKYILAKKGRPKPATTILYVVFYDETAQQLILVPIELRGVVLCG